MLHEVKKQYFCLCLDHTSNEGNSDQAIERAKQNGDKIKMLFTFNDATRFHTTFFYDRNMDTGQWLMDGEENGKLQPFSQVKLTNN